MSSVYSVLDISKYNSVSSYKLVGTTVDGVILRIGYRGATSGKIVMDPTFKKNAVGFTKAGVPWGVYFFTTAITAAEGKEEAKWVLTQLKSYSIHFPIFVDTEKGLDGGRSINIANSVRTTAVCAFCETIEAAGYTTGIYAADSWFVGKLVYSKISKYNKWVASYSKAPVKVTSYMAWQYTSSGKCKGISDDTIDLSHWYKAIVANPSSSSTTSTTESTTTNTTNTHTVPTRTLKQGCTGDDVKWLEYQLRTNKYNCTIDGTFGSFDYKAVSDYQYRHGLDIDGVVGSHTLASLKGETVTTFTAGTKLTVKNISLYTSSASTTATKKITKTIYLWDAKKVNNKVRITYSKSNVGKTAGVVGWINYSDIKSNF